MLKKGHRWYETISLSNISLIWRKKYNSKAYVVGIGGAGRKKISNSSNTLIMSTMLKLKEVQE